jgi:tRNA A-37 threonylcarbamoyl transferase component Bud32
MPNLTGQLLGKVRVDMFLARGGMADVFIGTHTTLHRAVAIKFLKGDLQDDPELRERFEREARVIAMLRHPNIVQVHDFDTFENQPYLVMEYVAGASLGTYLRELHKNNGRLDINQINKLLSKLASALKYAHDNDVIHRDIKPANILLTSRTSPISAGKPLAEDTEPIITDFGLVRFTQSNKQTSTGVITGTPVYMSPEQARGDRVDGRTDVYSLGVTVYEMLAGRVPFDSDSTLSLLHKQIYDPPPPIAGISTDLQNVMDRALAKDPEERFATPTEFAEAFQTAILGTTEAATMQFSNLLTHSNTLPRVVSTPIPVTNRVGFFIVLGVLGALVIGLAAFLRPQGSVLPTSTIPPAETQHSEMTNAPTSDSSEVVAPLADPVGLLRFQDGTAPADQVTLTTFGMALPPEGSQYEAWLIQDDAEQRVSIGIIQFDAENKSTLSFVDPTGRNLIGLYHSLEITLESNPDNSPNPASTVAFSATLPQAGYIHVRHLLFEFNSNPNQIGFIHGLDASTRLLNDAANAMLTSLQAGDNAGVRLEAEKMLNIISGTQSPEYKDWDGDGTISDSSDGFGLLLNGDNEGYIQGAFTHADLALTSEDATENMLTHGEHVKLSVANIGEWTPQLHDLLVAIIETPADAEVESLVRQAVSFSNQIRNGIDINGNENIEPIPGEGGAITAYQHAYYMADMTILP